MKRLKRFPILFACIFSLLMAACTEVEVTPKNTGDDDDDPIVLGPGG